MNGILVINQFLHGEKYDELTAMFQKAAKTLDISLKTVGNGELNNDWTKADFVLFWDKDILLAKWLEQQNIPVFNSSQAIDVCDHKGKTWLALERAKIPMPETILAPMTYENIGYSDLLFLNEIANRFSFPLVLKEAFGSFGQQVYLIHDMKELQRKTKELEGKPFLFQKYIVKSKGRDIRPQVVGDEVVAAMYRYSENDFRANITNGGKMKPYEPNEEERLLAVRAARAVDADFAGVDLLFSDEGPLVCEVNSNAHFKNIMDCTGVDTSVKILEYISKKAKR